MGVRRDYAQVVNDLDGNSRTRAECCGARVYLEYDIVAMLSPQLLIPHRSVQAEASGGTVDHEMSKGGPAKLQGLVRPLTLSKNSLRILIVAFTSLFHNIRVHAVLRHSRTL